MSKAQKPILMMKTVLVQRNRKDMGSLLLAVLMFHCKGHEYIDVTTFWFLLQRARVAEDLGLRI